MRFFTLSVFALAASAAAAQPAALTVSPDTLFWTSGISEETPYVLRNVGADSLRLDSLAIGPCSQPFCGDDLGPGYALRFEYDGDTYFGLLLSPDFKEWDPELPRVTMAPGDSAALYVVDIDGCPVCTRGGPEFDTVAPVLFWAGGVEEPVERTLAYLFPVASEPEATGATFTFALAGPNPFHRETALLLRVSAPAEVEVVLLDGLGRRVGTLAAGPLGAGEHRLVVRADGLAPGLYFVRAASRSGREASVATQRLVLLR